MDNLEPECSNGECTAIPHLQMCKFCGGLMFEEKGSWFHWSQEDIPFPYRVPQFVENEKDSLD